MEKFQNKYRIQSIRLQNWDYRWAGAYFITICTQNRGHYFGEIVDGKMQLSHLGIIADLKWYQIPFHTQNVELGAFVVMPNHIHGILIITQNDNDDGNNKNGTVIVETGHALSLRHHHQQQHQRQKNQQQNPPSEQSKTIGQQRFQNIGKNSIYSPLKHYLG